MIDALDGVDRQLWAVVFDAGLRRGELIGLRREDVNLARGVIHVRRGWDMLEGEVEPKSRKGKRKVPIPAVLRDHLDACALTATAELSVRRTGSRKRTNARATVGKPLICQC